MKWDTLPERFFSDEFMDKLLKESRIEECLRDDMHKGLENIARYWYFRRKSPESEMSPREIRDYLKSFQKEVRTFSKCLNKLPDAVWSTIVEMNYLSNPKHYKLRIDYVDTFRLESDHKGKPAIINFTSGSNEPPQSIEIKTLITALEALVSLSNVSPKIKSGPQEDVPLQKWIEDMHRLWVGVVGQPFTRLANSSGEPTSAAAYYCVKAYAILDPETRDTRIINEMRKSIANYSDASYRKN